MSDDIRGYYETLGVSPTASDSEIKKAFLKLAVELHPDKNMDPDTGAPTPESTEKFQRIQEAYQVLKDPKRRSAYDDGQEVTSELTIDQEATARIIQGFMPIMEQIVQGESVKSDVFIAMKTGIRQGVMDIKKGLRGKSDSIERLEAFKGRIEGPDDIFAKAVNDRIDGIKRDIKNSEHLIEVGERAIEMLQDYSMKDIIGLLEGEVSAPPPRQGIDPETGLPFDFYGGGGFSGGF